MSKNSELNKKNIKIDSVTRLERKINYFGPSIGELPLKTQYMLENDSKVEGVPKNDDPFELAGDEIYDYTLPIHKFDQNQDQIQQELISEPTNKKIRSVSLPSIWPAYMTENVVTYFDNLRKYKASSSITIPFKRLGQSTSYYYKNIARNFKELMRSSAPLFINPQFSEISEKTEQISDKSEVQSADKIAFYPNNSQRNNSPLVRIEGFHLK